LNPLSILLVGGLGRLVTARCTFVIDKQSLRIRQAVPRVWLEISLIPVSIKKMYDFLTVIEFGGLKPDAGIRKEGVKWAGKNWAGRKRRALY
jgi:hypothetical protein